MALLLQKEGINARSWQGWQFQLILLIITLMHEYLIYTKNLEEKFLAGNAGSNNRRISRN